MGKKYKDWLTLRRTSKMEFTVSGPHHCGVADVGEVQKAVCNVRVRCIPILDGRGFLFEQRSIDTYLQQIKRVESSCEVLSMKIAHQLEGVIKDENPDIEIKWIEVQIIADPYAASMMYRYHL